MTAKKEKPESRIIKIIYFSYVNYVNSINNICNEGSKEAGEMILKLNFFCVCIWLSRKETSVVRLCQSFHINKIMYATWMFQVWGECF